MQPGIFAKTFVRSSVEEVFAAVARLNLPCVQFNFACAGLPSLPDQIPPEVSERIRTAAAQNRIAIAAVSGTFNMIHPDPQQRQDGLRRLAVLAGACARLGTTVITLCTGTRDPHDPWRRHPDNGTPAAWRDLLATLDTALAIAEQHQVILGVEPETGNVIDSSHNARRLLDELRSPRLRIILDPANLFHPGDLPRHREILQEALALLGRDLILAHAKELGPDGQAGEWVPGDGVLPWDLYFELLAGSGYAGPVILHGFQEGEAARAAAFLRQRLATRGN